MAKRKRLSAAIDLGSSLIKIVGVCDGAMNAVVMLMAGHRNLTPDRTTIWVALSEKGGMGKTTVGLTIAELLTAAERQFFLIDADASTPNVGLTYRQEMYRGFRNSNPVVSEVESATVSRKDKSSTATKSKVADFVLQEQITFTGNADSYFHADK